MAHEWSYIKSSIKHQPQKTKELHALIIPGQLSCPLELKSLGSTLPHTCIWIGFSYLQFEGGLSSFHAANLIPIRFISNIFTEIEFLTFPPESQSHDQTMICIGWAKLSRILVNIDKAYPTYPRSELDRLMLTWNMDMHARKEVEK